MNTVHEEAERLQKIFALRKKEAKAAGQTLSQASIAKRCGWSGQSAVSQYMTGRIALNVEALLKLAKALSFNPRDVSPRLANDVPTLYISESANPQTNAGQNGEHIPLLPIVDLRSPSLDFSQIDSDSIVDWISAPGPVGPRAFAFINESISMQPRFADGDRIIIEPDADWSTGHFILAAKKSTATKVFRQLKREGADLYLAATNQAFEPRYIRVDDDWIIIGRARWIISEI
ncbi:hypothetical protein R84981_000955 [Carnimonas sp. R-84981]|uniref:LexA family protein n=1 Tax=Carnimonas bestiolae TaxID=3402172 RepID=UPI003EDC6F81